MIILNISAVSCALVESLKACALSIVYMQSPCVYMCVWTHVDVYEYV